MHWEAKAEYEDGATVEKHFAYREDGNAHREWDRQYELECWLIEEAHPSSTVTWYSVDFAFDDEED